ncbi:5-formyltetrahydrofolate cyclo-ligase [Erythrobacteraceae bacterium CFH 75059]|nr:5-formyltetrahydrofolate cyclo-ligase [Erythrobacteraceae bacterium CFH 75059]
MRRRLRAARRAHVEALPESTRALLFLRPPTQILGRIPEQSTIGLYDPSPFEAPTQGYARFFFERGHRLALPSFSTRSSPMHFAPWSDPYADDGLAPGPHGPRQPRIAEPPCEPQVLMVPLLGFTAEGDRLGQGGGHYDRFLAARTDMLVVGLAWDVQEVQDMPREAHDRKLDYVVTPSRVLGPF